MARKHDAALALEDGKVFFGWGFGFEGVSTGELCFSTSQTGYQETITDPSYKGQIIVFAFPHIGNVGINEEDMESAGICASGMVLSQQPSPPSNWRSQRSLLDFTNAHKVPGIWGVDTRHVVGYIRKSGAKNGALIFGEGFMGSEQDLVNLATFTPDYEEVNFIEQVSCGEPYHYNRNGDNTVVVMDFGVKRNILRLLDQNRMNVIVVPYNTTLERIMSFAPAGIVISNGPGDPNIMPPQVMKTVKGVVDSGLPVLGICLGFQLLALALGSPITKMKQGHRGINQPSYNLRDKNVAIGSHNHGYSLCKESAGSEIQPFSVSLFDGCIEAFSARDGQIMAVQYHPEGSPGPQENTYVFEDFAAAVKKYAH